MKLTISNGKLFEITRSIIFFLIFFSNEEISSREKDSNPYRWKKNRINYFIELNDFICLVLNITSYGINVRHVCFNALIS